MNFKLGIILPLILAIPTGFAGTVTGSMQSNATIASACSVSTTNLSFGTYSPNAGDSFATGNLNITCTKGTSVKIGINTSASGVVVTSTTSYGAEYTKDGQTWSRYMANGSNQLLYNIFQDASHTKVFGGPNWYAADTTTQETLTATGVTQAIPFYAAMGGGQYVVPGSYLDTAVAVLTY